jgi:hypothetical protein
MFGFHEWINIGADGWDPGIMASGYSKRGRLPP